MKDQQMIEAAQAAGYRLTRPYGEYGTHTICRHGRIEKNGKKKHRCIRYALVPLVPNAPHEPRRDSGVALDGVVGNSDLGGTPR